MPDTVQVARSFECSYETKDLATFQREGHFVPAMQDEEQRRRPWEGDTVHILQLDWHRTQVLRVLADSREEVVLLMGNRIHEYFFGMWVSAQTTTRLIEVTALMQEERNNVMEALRGAGLPLSISDPVKGIEWLKARAGEKSEG
jgi:hypothetical protein